MPDRPIPKPKQFLKVLDILNTQDAANMIDPKSYADMVGQYAFKAYKNDELSYRDYLGIVKPLFGKAGEMVSKKIEERDKYLERYATGGRVKYSDGSDEPDISKLREKIIELMDNDNLTFEEAYREAREEGYAAGGRVNFNAGGSDPKTGQGFQKGNTGFRTKDGEVRNVTGKNQFTTKTPEEIRAIINNPKYKDYTPSKFRTEKLLSRTETDKIAPKYNIKFKRTGPAPADPEKQKTQKAITSKKRIELLKKKSNPNIEKQIAGKGGLHLSHIGQYNTPVTLSNLAYLPADVNIKSYENFEKKIQNNFNKILTVYRNEKLKPEVKTEKIAALMKEDRQLRSDNPKYANIKSRMSIRRTALDPSGIMIKEKIRDPKMTIGKGEAGLNLKEAKPRSSERKGILTIAKNALQSLKGKGAPGLGSSEFKDPLGGQIDLIDVKKLIKRPDNV